MRVGGLDMFTGAAIAVAAGADLVVEGAVDLFISQSVSVELEGLSTFTYLILLRPKDGGEIIRHDLDNVGCIRGRADYRIC